RYELDLVIGFDADGIGSGHGRGYHGGDHTQSAPPLRPALAKNTVRRRCGARATLPDPVGWRWMAPDGAGWRRMAPDGAGWRVTGGRDPGLLEQIELG